MNKNKKIGFVVVGVVVLVLVFYGGMVYGKGQAASARATAFAGGFSGRTRGMGGVGVTGGFANGQIIAKDANSITVQLMAPAGNAGGVATPTGSKIVLLDSSTKISKQDTGTLADLIIGTQVSVTGTPNADGSVGAQTVQIRANTPTVVK